MLFFTGLYWHCSFMVSELSWTRRRRVGLHIEKWVLERKLIHISLPWLEEERKDRRNQVLITPMVSFVSVATTERLWENGEQLYHYCLGLRAMVSSGKDEESPFEMCLTLACKQVNCWVILPTAESYCQLEHVTMYFCVNHSQFLSFSFFKWKMGVNDETYILGVLWPCVWPARTQWCNLNGHGTRLMT